MFSKIKLLVIFLSILIKLYPQSEDISFTHFTSEDGLSLNSATQIIQDKRGFLWIGTYNGINRFDGYNFKVFLPDPNNPKSISNHSIWAIHEDRDGYIWIGTLNGLNRYDWRTEEFHVYKRNVKDSNSISNNSIYSIYEDKSGNLWFGTLNGLNKYNKEKDNFTVITKVSDVFNPFNNSVTTINEDKDGLLWLGTWNGISCIDKNGNLVKQYFAESTESRNFDFRKIGAIFRDSDNKMWIGTNGSGLKKYDPVTDTFKEYISIPGKKNTISNNYITAIFQDRDKIIWIATKNGFNKYNAAEDNFTRIYNDPNQYSSIINDEILSIRQDNSGLIWVGTSGGVSRFFTSNNKFHFLNKYSKDKSLISNNVTSLYIDKDQNIWIGTFEGLDLIKKNSKKVIHFKHDPNNPNSISSDYIFSVSEDSDGYIWIGTHSRGLNRFNPKTGEFKHFLYSSLNLESISNNGILSICDGKKDKIWFGTWWGFNGFDKKSGKFKRYHSNLTTSNSIKNNLIWKVYEDSDGMIWLGTDGGGASMFNPVTETFTNFNNDTSSQNYISGYRVFDILQTSDGKIWFATTDGLNCYNKKTGKTKIYTAADGLPSTLTGNLIEDNNGFLWIGGDKGLSKMDIKKETFTNYSKRHGLKDLEISNNISAIDENGTLYFGTKNGIIYFHPDSIDQAAINSPVVFTDLKIYNESVKISKDGILTESITGAKEIKIPSSNDVITFEFALLEYFDVKRNIFRFKLEGFDKNWNEVGSRNAATYTNLPPGEYIFRIKASGSNSHTSEKEASLHVKIVAEYYQTWWFKLSAGLFSIFVALLIFQYRTRAIQRYSRLLEKKVSERTKDLDNTINELSLEIIERKKAEYRAQISLDEKEILLSEKVHLLKEKEILLKEIHHRVKNNLQVISSLLYLNSKKIKDPEVLNMFKDSQNRVKSIALVHERLYQSRDLGKIDFREYVQRLTADLFRSYGADQSKIKLEININNIFVNVDIAVPCGLIINELISNSLKYAFPGIYENNKTGLIKVSFNRNNENIPELIVSDNGIGMPEEMDEKKKHSLGLQLVDTLVAQLDGKLELDLNEGTEYKIKLNFR